jgi:hypothetical protein
LGAIFFKKSPKIHFNKIHILADFCPNNRIIFHQISVHWVGQFFALNVWSHCIKCVSMYVCMYICCCGLWACVVQNLVHHSALFETSLKKMSTNRHTVFAPVPHPRSSQTHTLPFLLYICKSFTYVQSFTYVKSFTFVKSFTYVSLFTLCKYIYYNILQYYICKTVVLQGISSMYVCT